jgi:hypothetical protein
MGMIKDEIKIMTHRPDYTAEIPPTDRYRWLKSGELVQEGDTIVFFDVMRPSGCPFISNREIVDERSIGRDVRECYLFAFERPL